MVICNKGSDFMFGELLKTARKNKGYTLDELAAIYNEAYGKGLNKGTLSKYENEKQEPMISVVNNLSTILNVSTDYLLGKQSLNTFEYPSNIFPIEKRKIPLLGTIAAGQPISDTNEFECYVEVGTNVNADFCLHVRGDSMINARINDGDIVFIKKQPDVDDGEIAAVLIEEEATLKRVYKDKKSITLVAENPNYKPMVYYEEDCKNIIIIGKAIAFQSDVR
jgi:repressor LexA